MKTLLSSWNPFKKEHTSYIESKESLTLPDTKNKVTGYSPVDTLAPYTVNDISDKTSTTSKTLSLEVVMNENQKAIQEELEKGENLNFERLQALIFQAVMLQFRTVNKNSQEHLSKMGLEIQVKAKEVKDLHNNMASILVTIGVAGVSIGAGLAGLSPLLQGSVLSENTVKILVQASNPLSTATTGMSGISGIIDKKQSSEREFEQHALQRLQSKEEGVKSSKRDTAEIIKAAKNLTEEFYRTLHQTASAMSGQ